MSDRAVAALKELQDMAEHARALHVTAQKFGINQTSYAIVPAWSVLDVVGRALREVAVQQAIPLEPPMSETVRKP